MIEPDSSRRDVDLLYWREYILNAILFVGVILGTVTYVPSLYMSIVGGVYGVAFIDTVVLLIAVGLFFGKRIPFHFRSVGLISMMYVLGVWLLVSVGPISQIYLFAFSVMAGLLLGVRAAIAALVLNAVTLLFVGFTSGTGFYSPFLPEDNRLVAWSVTTLNFLFVNAVISLSLSVLLKGLEQSLASANAATSALRDEQSQLLRSNLLLHEEMAERKRVEQELHQLGMAVEQASEVIAIIDTEGKVLYVNSAYERLTGIPRQERLQQAVDVLVEIDSTPGQGRPLWEAISAGSALEGRFKLRKGDGGTCSVEMTVSRMFNNLGEMVSYVIVLRDVSQEAIMEQRLQQAAKLESIGTLAGGIAHDFNNILASILGHSELLLRGNLHEDESRGSAEEIVQASLRARDLVRQILTFSRQLEVQCRNVSLKEVVDEAMRLLRPTIPSTIEIVVETNGHSGHVFADPIQLHQVVMNLCANAYHAMEAGGGVLSISLDEIVADDDLAGRYPHLESGKEFVQLLVNDTGHGMDAQTMERIFDPFFTTKEKGKGTGLGLSTVHGIVSSLGGEIAVYSEVGKGTSFTVYFPRLAPAEIPSNAPRAGSVESGGNQRIMLVDDEDALLRLGQRMLEGFGYRVVTYNRSPVALEEFRKSPEAFDLVITDQTMPSMTGTQFAQELRAIRANLPIILLSGFSEQSISGHAGRNGLFKFVHKPFTRVDLARAVAESLQAASKGDEPAD
ncbi:MAG: response regulator [Candidatus Hydrogenedentes bacterium]|nr:response regulator [Candidatus Hydrogenedentota bacterium]